MNTLPSGTVTFLFTDVEGSTRLLHELGDDYAGVLAEHRRVLREAFARYGGVEVDTQGDAFFVAFAKASDALAAAAAAREELGTGPIRVRIGVHTGEPVVTDEGYVGMDVHRAARIAAAGHGGQVLVSQSTRELVGVDELRELGEHRLKDLTAPERIYQLGADEFPPLKTLNATNLPVASSALVGRDAELAELVSLLSGGTRLVTLTGPGGSGKTRLALQVGAELVEEFPGGVFFVPLAGVAHADLVEGTIAAAIGVRSPGELHDRTALLVVDNFEHVIDAAAVVANLLAAAPSVKVLATSRAPLRIAGEHEYPVEPLPDEDALTLLTERARAVRPDFTPDVAAREVCRRLDGLPLALELAAPRLRSLSAESLLERLDRRLPLLTAGRRDAPERQRTLRATIEWSYELLASDLRDVFAQVGIFAGTFSLAAAEAVTDATLDDVDALVEASLLKPVGDDRFLMLETIREFAREQLGQNDALAQAHAEYLADLAERANLHAESTDPMRHDLVLPEADNIRAALEWMLATGRGELGLTLAGALENYWVTSDPFEGRRWFEALLPMAPRSPSPLTALARRCLGNCVTMSGDVAGGQTFYEQSAAEYRALGDELRAAVVDHRIANAQLMLGNFDQAGEIGRSALATFERHESRRGEAQVLLLLGDLALREGRAEEALELYTRSLALAEQTGFRWWEKNALFDQALAHEALGRGDEALGSAAAGIDVARSIADRPGMVQGAVLLMRLFGAGAHRETAGVLYGAAEADVARQPLATWSFMEAQVQKLLPELEGADFERGRLEGRTLSLNDAISRALES